METPNERDRERREELRREEVSEGRTSATEDSTAGRAERLASERPVKEEQAHADEEPNPPHTTTGKVTAPKFGSAGSGGAELEPGPERP